MKLVKMTTQSSVGAVPDWVLEEQDKRICEQRMYKQMDLEQKRRFLLLDTSLEAFERACRAGACIATKRLHLEGVERRYRDLYMV